jgi:hypothetical protein
MSQKVLAFDQKVLAFDIGIKNLAFCILNGNQVQALENVNLLPEVEAVYCASCKLRASFQVKSGEGKDNGRTVYCKRHVPKTHAILKELSGKKLPTHAVLKELVKTHGVTVQGQTKEKCLDALATKFAFPFEQPKQANASHVSLELIHDALRAFALRNGNLFTGCTHVLLENQPAFKNPHMKSVQVLLFATLREQFLQRGETPAYHFVHAKKKVQDAQKGDAGYAERKNKSEGRLVQMFESGDVIGAEWYEKWKLAGKKSDMADALCMAVDGKI